VPGFDLIVQLRLQSYFAGLSYLDDDASLEVIRRRVAIDLQRLEAEQLAQIDFIRDCVLMAANNMQDARLHLLESEIQRMKTPLPKQWGEFIIEAVLILTMELAVVLLPHLAAGALVPALAPLFASRNATSRRRHARLDELTAAHATESAAIEAARPNIVQLQRWLLAEEARLAGVRREVVDGRLLAEQDALQHLVEEALEATARRDALRDQIDVVRKLVQATDAVAVANAPKVAAAFVTNEPVSSSPAWKLFGKLRTTTENRLGQSMGEELADAAGASSAAVSPTGSSGVFFTSDVLGRQLESLRARAVSVRSVNARLREELDTLTWDVLLEDEYWQEVIADLAVMPAWLAAQRETSGPGTEGLVVTTEALLWYEWLSVTGALTVEYDVTYTHRSSAMSRDVAAGEEMVAGAYWLIERTGTPRGMPMPLTLISGVTATIEQDYRAHRFAGIPMLTEFQAGYLYTRFASRLSSAAEPPPYDASAVDFSRIPALAAVGFWGQSNVEREQLIAKQKIMVILAFRAIGAQIESVRQRLLSSDQGFSEDDLELPLGESLATAVADLAVAPDGGTADQSAAAREAALNAARDLRGAQQLYDLVRVQIDAMPTSPAEPRQKLEAQLYRTGEQAKRSRQALVDAMATLSGDAAQTVRQEVEAIFAPGTLDAALQWQTRATRPRPSLVPSVWDTMPTE
jgi:hypothetical protein